MTPTKQYFGGSKGVGVRKNTSAVGHPGAGGGVPPASVSWEAEREKILQRICEGIKERIESGESLGRCLRRVSRRWDHKTYRTNPRKKLALAFETARAWWYAWRRGGEVPSAFRIHYKTRRILVPVPVLIRFSDACASRRWANVKAAWREFESRPGAFARGRPSRKKADIRYDQLRYWFPSSFFRAMQAQLKAIDLARTELARLRFGYVAGIRALLPDRLARNRTGRKSDFQI
jgi:hypothetical protein